MYPSFPFLRPTVVIATVLTTLQSLTWIAMTLTSIIFYYCRVDVKAQEESIVESLLSRTMYRQYFKSADCVPKSFNDSLFTVLDTVSLTKPLDMHAISWTYLALSFFWLVSGMLLFLYVKKRSLKNASFFIYLWVFNTLIIAIADLVVGIFMAVDYSSISKKLEDFTFEHVSSENIAVILTARTVSWLLLAISFRGFILWVLNVLLSCYLITHVFAIQKYNKVEIRNFVNNAFIHNETRKPSLILGYDPFAPKAFYGNSDSLTEIPRPKIQKAQTLNNQQRAAALSLHLDHTPEKEFSYLEGGRTRPTSTFIRGYQKSNSVPRPDYSPEVPRALRLPDSIIDEHPQAVLRQSKNFRRY